MSSYGRWCCAAGMRRCLVRSPRCGVWVIFTTLNLHRMGEALMRASSVEYRAAGKRKKRIAGLIAVLLIGGVRGVDRRSNR